MCFNKGGGSVAYEIPTELLMKACNNIGSKFGKMPFKLRGITINTDLIKATMELLNNESSKILPQNSRNASREKTPEGLDKKIKEVLNTDLRTANIISDILKDVAIVDIIDVESPVTRRRVKGTKLLSSWQW